MGREIISLQVSVTAALRLDEVLTISMSTGRSGWESESVNRLKDEINCIDG